MKFEQLTDYKAAGEPDVFSDPPTFDKDGKFVYLGVVPYPVPAFRVLDLPIDVSFLSIVVHNILSSKKPCGYLKSYWRAAELVTGRVLSIEKQRSRTAAANSAFREIRWRMLGDGRMLNDDKGRYLMEDIKILYTGKYAINPQYIDECLCKMNNYLKELTNDGL